MPARSVGVPVPTRPGNLNPPGHRPTELLHLGGTFGEVASKRARPSRGLFKGADGLQAALYIFNIILKSAMQTAN